MTRRGVLSRQIIATIATALFAHQLFAGDLPGDYFPDGKFDSSDVDQWYGKYLASMEEPSLYKIAQKDSSAQFFRVTYLPPYSPFVALKLEVRPNGSGLLELKKMEQIQSNGGYVPGRIVRKALMIIPAKSVTHFQALLKNINFWHLPTHSTPHGPAVLGGDMFLYESAWHGKYHVIEAPDPENPELIGPGLYLLKLAGEKEPD
jgi:hypothetical protein